MSIFPYEYKTIHSDFHPTVLAAPADVFPAVPTPHRFIACAKLFFRMVHFTTSLFICIDTI